MITPVIPDEVMRKVQLKDAKARLSALVDEAVRGKPSVITRHGKAEAVVLGYAEWQLLSRVPSFGRLLMSAPLKDGDAPPRARAVGYRWRSPRRRRRGVAPARDAHAGSQPAVDLRHVGQLDLVADHAVQRARSA